MTAWLSRATLRPEAIRRGSPPDLDVGGWHRQMWKLLEAPAGAGRDFLFRVEDDERPPRALVLSDRPPRLDDARWRVETRPFAPDLRAGDALAFSLRANATVKRDGKRHDIVRDAALSGRYPADATREVLASQVGPDWLRQRSEALGFGLRAVAASRYTGHRAWRRDQPPLRMSSLDFDGTLEVLDVARFLTTLRRGIGHARGFGCGLLLIRRL